MNEIILTRESSEEQIKQYFIEILKLSKLNNQYPVDFDTAWMLVYTDKHKAVEELKDKFLEDVDYQALTQKVVCKNGIGSSRLIKYFLSVSCLEFFIARKVRPVFEIYRQVFHQVVNQVILPKTYIEALEALLESEKQKQQLQIEAKEANDHVQRLTHDSKTYTTSEIAKELNLKSANQLNKILEDKGIQYKLNGTWLLYSNYADKDYVSIKQQTLDNGKIIYDRRWNNKGRDFILELLKER